MDTDLRQAEERIGAQLTEIEESMLYLGVLRKMPLMEARGLFESRFERILDLFDRVWEKEPYPEPEDLFTLLGEDYEKIRMLVHANDALDPIYTGLASIFTEMERFRDAGLDAAAGKERLAAIQRGR